MSKRTIEALDLDIAERARTWLMAFGALARSKEWKDTPANEEADTPAKLEITDNFMANCGLDALEKVQFIVAPKKILNLTYNNNNNNNIYFYTKKT